MNSCSTGEEVGEIGGVGEETVGFQGVRHRWWNGIQKIVQGRGRQWVRILLSQTCIILGGRIRELLKPSRQRSEDLEGDVLLGLVSDGHLVYRWR